MKAFIKYDFYFQVLIYIGSFLWSSLSEDFTSTFAVSLFAIGCSQTISYIIRVGILEEKNRVFNIYTIAYCIFLISILILTVVKLEFMFWFITILINIMALLFLISSFLDYKNRESTNF